MTTPKVVAHGKIKKGDVVNVIYKNETVSGVTTENGHTFIETAEGQYSYAADNGHPATFEMVKESTPEPKNWPPAKNDVWEATDAYGSAVFYHGNKLGKLVRLDNSTTTSSLASEVLEAFNGKLTLRFRPGLDTCSLSD